MPKEAYTIERRYAEAIERPNERIEVIAETTKLLGDEALDCST